MWQRYISIMHIYTFTYLHPQCVWDSTTVILSNQHASFWINPSKCLQITLILVLLLILYKKYTIIISRSHYVLWEEVELGPVTTSDQQCSAWVSSAWPDPHHRDCNVSCSDSMSYNIIIIRQILQSLVYIHFIEIIWDVYQDHSILLV